MVAIIFYTKVQKKTHAGDFLNEPFQIVLKDCINLPRQRKSWGFMPHSVARVILEQVVSIITCGAWTHTEWTTCD